MRARAPQRPTDQERADGIRVFLIADIRGYTLFTQERGDAAAAALVARFASICREEVVANHGSVIEVRGDEALAVFRSPRQAIAAAVELQAAFVRETAAGPDLPLPVGFGLDAGEAVPIYGDYRGRALNVAARLCAVAGPGEILATRSVVHLAGAIEDISYVDRGELHPKGLVEPVHALAIASTGVDVAEKMRSLAPKRRGRSAFGGRMQFRILGPLEVDAGGGPLPLGGPKQRAVLAHLLIRANELVPTERLIDEIWADEPPERAKNIIQTYVSNLRGAIGRDRIHGQAPGYRLRLDPIELDAARFDDLVRDAKRHVPVDPRLAVGTFDDALALWRGPALAGLADQPALLAEAARLDNRRLEAQEGRIEALLETGAPARAIGELEVIVAHHRLREKLWSLLMLALYREGRQAESLGAYQRAREILADELGIDPSPELRRLHQRILRQDPGLDLRGEPLRGYRLLEKIGTGPIGAVFRAIQPRVERDVAVKIFDEQIAADPAFARRFEREARAVAALEHPHIAPIYDYWREPGRAYIVSRYLRGGSLRALLERGEPLAPDRALHVLEQISLALAFAHRQGIAHGSVGPPNVLFDLEGNAHLGDFHVGVGTAPDAAAVDVRSLAQLVRGLFGNDAPDRLQVLIDRVDRGESIDADAFADAARAILEPVAGASPRPADERNPYKGLRAFNESDTNDFFGRSALVRRLVTRLDEDVPSARFLAVVGASGCGKSSLVRAGLVPAIRSGVLEGLDEPFVAEMLPRAHPFDELEAALLRIAVRPVARLGDLLASGSRGLLEAVDLVVPDRAELVLVVDQFEEVFTATSDEGERERFLESLRVATADPESRIRVIVTLRGDFYDRPLNYARFGDLLAARSEAVPPLSPDELEEAIRRPAEQVGVAPQPGLVAEMVADVVHQPGALPLLQHALAELFERRDDDRLSATAYREIGGIAGALSVSADRIWEAADAEVRRAITQVFLRLVTLGEGRHDTRRRVTMSELDALGLERETIETVLEGFGRRRFLTFDREPATREPTVEIAHEALLTSWRRLRGWIDDAREDLRHEARLAKAAAEWRAAGTDPSFLMRGIRLEQLEIWASATDLTMGRSEAAFLRASVEHRDQEREEDRRRRDREADVERRSRTRLRALVAVLAVAALVAGSLTLVATGQSRRAAREAERAREASAMATARRLAAAAIASLEVDPERGILLAMEAVALTRSIDGTVLPEAAEALHRAVASSRLVLSVPDEGGLLAWSAKGVFVTEGSAGSGMVKILDGDTGELAVSPFEGHEGDINDVAFSPDGSRLATTGDDGALKVWDPSSGDPIATWSSDGQVWGPSFSADGSQVAAAWASPTSSDGTVRVFDVASGSVTSSFRLGGAIDTAISPDGERVAVGSYFGHHAVIDVDTGKELRRLLAPNCCTVPSARGVAWSPNGRFIAATNEGSVRIWDAQTGRQLHTLLGHAGFVYAVAWSADSRRLVTGGSDGVTKVWEVGLANVREQWSLSSGDGQSGIVGVAFSPDGHRVMAGDAGITAVNAWDLGPGGDAEWAHLPATGGGNVQFLPAGTRVVTEGDLRRVESQTVVGAGLDIWDVTTGRIVRSYGPARDAFFFTTLDVSPDGSSVVLGGGVGECCNGRLRVWSVETGRELDRMTPGGGDVLAVAFGPDGQRMVSGGWADESKVWDADGRLLTVLADRGYVGYSADFSPDGRLIAIAAIRGSHLETGHVKIWDWRHHRLVQEIDAPGAASVDFDPSSDRIGIATWEGVAGVWDVESGQRVTDLAGHSGKIDDLSFSPDGSLIATAGVDGRVRVFDAGTGDRRLVLRHACGVNNLDFSPDGSMLASIGPCDGVRVWALDIDDLLDIARREVLPALTDEACRDLFDVSVCSDV